ncbi:gamma-glutamylcyclotransferase [Brucella sp. BE17]|uniref:gamma-glutamylcyclotransferase n=1 Tax=Brucella sp. BE17 TaxID=3142977 RepID=UPI0031B9E812
MSALPQMQEDIDPRERGLFLTEDELDRSLAQMIESTSSAHDVWVFAYGSLIWNPIFPVAEARRALIHGYHRSLCMNSVRGRGSIDNPGAMLALDAGGACNGIIMRIGGDVSSELKLLWRREMMSGAYLPKWLDAKTNSGPIRALCFVANRTSPHYAGRLSDDEVSRRVATASGIWGSNLDYVQRTHESLVHHGIRDKALSRTLMRDEREGRSETCPDCRT